MINLSVQKFVILTLLVATGLAACKKDSDVVTPGNTSSTSTDAIDVRDSAYYYSLLYYLWNDNLPDYNAWYNSDGSLIVNSKTTFKPHTFANADSVMSASTGIRAYSGKGTSGEALDRYSFAIAQTEWEGTASGSNLGFGFRRGYVSDTDQRVVYVYKNSPIGRAGVQRGWQIVSVNGIAATLANETSFYNSLSSNATSIFVFKTDTGEQKTITLTKASYKANFVQKDTIIVSGGLKIGYIALSSFLGDNDGADTEAELDAAIDDLKSTGITDLIIDLRYNGGGYTSVSEYFANLVAPASAKGKTMYRYQYNDLLTQYYQSIGESTEIAFNTQSANFNLTRIVFIVSEETASASELLINNLKPYLNVTLVGTPTYGKPVGFPGILIEMSKTDVTQNYYVFPIAFKTVNANSQGDYFDGMAVDITQADDFTYDWGNPNEACMSAAIRYLTTGSTARQSARMTAEKLETLNRSVTNENLGGIGELILNKKMPAMPGK
jgi:C-terminal processing protease CtpA/Prc